MKTVGYVRVSTDKQAERGISVEVLAKGFRHENRQYSSLSAIATAITGTRWNGLAFFGLRSACERHGIQSLRVSVAPSVSWRRAHA